MLSPRLMWMKKHEVNSSVDKIGRWTVWCGNLNGPIEPRFQEMTKRFAIGETENEALYNLARYNDWKLWNEENL